jgi:hypothetical protein
LGTKYSSQSTSGYNSSPPVDDGTASEANKVKWSTIKTKLADVLKTFGEAINTALVATLNTAARAISASDSATATDHWRTIQVNTASVSVTLADATTMAAGYIVNVANQSSGSVTIGLATSTDTIDTVTNTTQLLGPKEVREYIVNATATGYITKSSRVSIDDLTEDTTPDLGADYVSAYDASGTTLKKVLLGRMGSGVLGTEQATTSGTSIDFTGIPSWAKKITINLVGVSTSGTNDLLLQLGDSGGVEATGYLSAFSVLPNASAIAGGNTTTAFTIASGLAAASVLHGSVVLTLENASSFTWCERGTVAFSNTGTTVTSAGSKSTSAALDRVRITTTGGTDTFDAGAVNILYS